MTTKKSTKTAHVLGLIAGGNEESFSPEPETAQVSSEENTAKATMEPNSSVEIKTAEDTSHISEAIREKLLETLEPQTTTKADVPETEAETPETEAPAPEIQATEPEVEVQNTTDNDFEAVLRNDADEIIAGVKNFVYINIVETFVKEVIVDYMKQYGTCTCNHCIIDTMALALTNLPPKYIVAEKGALAPRLNFYRSQYTAKIATEVLKACLVVGKSPHHKR